jgi:hypothetical protein
VLRFGGENARRAATDPPFVSRHNPLVNSVDGATLAVASGYARASAWRWSCRNEVATLRWIARTISRRFGVALELPQ